MNSLNKAFIQEFFMNSFTSVNKNYTDFLSRFSNRVASGIFLAVHLTMLSTLKVFLGIPSEMSLEANFLESLIRIFP